jgi:cell division protein FtsL
MTKQDKMTLIEISIILITTVIVLYVAYSIIFEKTAIEKIRESIEIQKD